MKKATSSELTGGEGFTYEDLVVAYFLVALLREERAAATRGVVVRVAIQQAAQGEPLDDLIVDADLNAEKSRLSLQVKRSLTISAAVSNTDFREIIARSRATRRKADFRIGVDRYGFVARSVADERLGSLQRIIRKAQASITGEEFAGRFQTGGEASQLDITLRNDLRTLIEPTDDNDEADFYRHLVAVRLDNLELDGDRHAELVNRLSELTADGSGAGLLDSICQAARSGAGAAHVWNRPSLLGQLRQRIQLIVAPSYAEDIKTLTGLAKASVRNIRHDIDGVALDRPALREKATRSVSANRFVNIGGLPGCGKSVLLRGMVLEALEKGPVLFLKADRLEGASWRSFATALGLRHAEPLEILAEIGSTGTDVLFIDGIDRIKAGQRSIVLDLLSAIEREPALSNWRVVATSRDQGLEVLRSWVPPSFYRGRGIENVPVAELNDEECTKLCEAKPQLTPLLFGPLAVREIARRPFFAAVLADQVARGLDGKTLPQTESELISVWWRAGGYAASDDALLRQRAIIDLAEAGAATLGKAIPARNLQQATVSQATALRVDHVVDFLDEGARISFAHDIFFEWAYFRLLIDRGADWTSAIVAAGEPPLLGRIVSLYSQRTLELGGDWVGEYRKLDSAELRPQWKRAWLLGPPASPNFVQCLQPFEALLFADNFALLDKFLVWFQAERTTPNALVLNNPAVSLDGAALVRAADYLGWPSDVTAWARLLNWLIARQSQIPASSAALSVELFGVWQNMFSDFPNPLSKTLLGLAEVWLTEIETLGAIPPGKREPSRWDLLSGKGLGAFATALRQLILRSARGYPEPAVRLVDRAIAIERRDQALFEEIIAFSPTLARSCPERLADLVRAEVVEDLPREKRDRERAQRKAYYDLLARIRAKPEAERTPLEKQTLSTMSPIYGQERYDFDDVGIDRHHGAFFPPTPLTEPFASLFDAAPDIARALGPIYIQDSQR